MTNLDPIAPNTSHRSHARVARRALSAIRFAFAVFGVGLMITSIDAMFA